MTVDKGQDKEAKQAELLVRESSPWHPSERIGTHSTENYPSRYNVIKIIAVCKTSILDWPPPCNSTLIAANYPRPHDLLKVLRAPCHCPKVEIRQEWRC